MSVYERLLQPENLNYAWSKTRNLLRIADGHIDNAETAAFELDLENRLNGIHRQFEQGRYRLKRLRPLPRPKKISHESPVDRQYYHVSIEDQVAWIALTNAIGPELDQQMEAWSYGNRLYRPAWYEPNEEGRSELEIGPYRHASGQLYRRFKHSWPLFRRHVTLTTRMMAKKGRLSADELDKPDQLADATAIREKLIYFENDFWKRDGEAKSQSTLFHASIDLEKFYPNLKTEAVIRGLSMAGALEEPKIAQLVRSMLDFRLDLSDMPVSSLENVEPKFLKTRFEGIPTGLFVSGFLANAAMLPVDKRVAEKIYDSRRIAHFRFVDDHTIIGYDFNELCKWVVWYEQLLNDLAVGPQINIEKTDPPEFGRWIEAQKKALDGNSGKLYEAAKLEARLDGKNPTKLMTKTLAQVSALAATDIHILDDDDLDERLGMLEWLLLADIPEREIRPDTRASFAAGQIASLAPLLVQEADGLVSATRAISAHRTREPDPERSTEDERQSYKQLLAALETNLASVTTNHNNLVRLLLQRCFDLLLQALREHPGKARLFYRIHEYCRTTGHQGLRSVAGWIAEIRENGWTTWADYYSSLSLQIMAKGLLLSVARLAAPGSLRSDIAAAESHLEDVASLDLSKFSISPDRLAWFHLVGRREFGVALLQAAEFLKSSKKNQNVADKLFKLSSHFVSLSSASTSHKWIAETGWSSGVWAHLAENVLASENSPTKSWLALSSSFDFEIPSDLKAVRRYPRNLPDAAWKKILDAEKAPPPDDSAWLREVIGNNEQRNADAQKSSKRAFARAARSLRAVNEQQITASEWTQKLESFSRFDPRRSEWTALEIVRQLLANAISLDGDPTLVDRIHPDNILLPSGWIAESSSFGFSKTLGWDEWREFVRDDRNGGVELCLPSSSLLDYRFASSDGAGVQISRNERRLNAVGRLLFGLLLNDFSTPSVWNVRGNELIYRLPRTLLFSELAISSLTTQLIDACLSARPAESRVISVQPELFAWQSGQPLNDAMFDPEPILGLNDLLDAVRESQKILQDNQLSVSAHQPRQVIPFRISDFAAGQEGNGANEEDVDGNVE